MTVTVPGLGQAPRPLSVWYEAPAAGKTTGGTLYAAAASPVTVAESPLAGVNIRAPSLPLGLPSHVEFPGNAAPGASLPVARSGGDLNFYASFDATKDSYWAADFTLTYPDGVSQTFPMNLADVRPSSGGAVNTRFAAGGPNRPGLVMATVRLKAPTPDTSVDQAKTNLRLKARHEITNKLFSFVDKSSEVHGTPGVAQAPGWETFIHSIEWIHIAYEAWETNERFKRLILDETMRHWNEIVKYAVNDPKLAENYTIPQEMIRPLGEEPDPDAIRMVQWLGWRLAVETQEATGPNRFDPGKDGNDLFVNLNNYLSKYADVDAPAGSPMPWNLDNTGKIVNIWVNGGPTRPGGEGTSQEDKEDSFVVVSLVDPSGTVTDAATGQPVAGATATLLAQEPSTGAFSLYPTDFIVPAQNPQTTDATGHYGWDVPPGTYQVEVRAQGYRPAVSAPVTVPPPATGVNFGLSPGPFLINIPVILKSYPGGW